MSKYQNIESKYSIYEKGLCPNLFFGGGLNLANQKVEHPYHALLCTYIEKYIFGKLSFTG